MNLLFVRHLTVIDFSYLDPRRGVVGESWIVDVELDGDLDAQGMVFDFSKVKKTIKQGIDQFIDHKLAIPMKCSAITVEKSSDQISARLPLEQGGEIRHESPAQAVTLIEAEAITADSVVPALIAALRPLLPDNVKEIHMRLREEGIESAYYHYSHGLKKHDGNCQRIAHGHRSRLEILENGQRNQRLEYAWAQQWQDIYIGTSEDISEQPLINNIPHTAFRYQANQGEFAMMLPSRQVYLIDCDSTVEWLARHIADTLKGQYPHSIFEVRAFEGVDKGAIAIS